jgi:hypothetical protein
MLKAIHKVASLPRRGIHAKPAKRNWSRKSKALGLVAGVVLAAGAAGAATNWIVGLNTGSSANAQGASIQNLTISDVTTGPTETNKLSPGGTGDITFTLSNPNPFPVTVTGIQLPEENLTTNDAVGFPTSAVNGTAISGCGATTSTVIWKNAVIASNVQQSFSTGTFPFAIAAGATNVTVTLTNDATMDSTAPLACAGTATGTAPNQTYGGAWFVMPSLFGVLATGGTFAGSPTPIASSGSVTTGY